MTRITSTNTEYFRENNLSVCLELLSDNGMDKSEKTILLVGASAKELISIRILALRMGLSKYKFVGINNNDEQVQRFFEYQNDSIYDTWLSPELAFREGFQFSDIQNGYLRIQYSDNEGNSLLRFNPVCFENVAMTHGDIIDGVFCDGVFFDGIICNNVLIHQDEGERFLSLNEIIKMLTDEGYFLRDKGDNGYVSDTFSYRNQIVQDSIDSHAPRLRKLPLEVNVYTKSQNNPVVGENRLK